MNWLFASIIVVSAGYLTHMIITLLNRLNALRPRIAQLERQVAEQEAAWDRCEGMIMETEHKVAYLEEEALRYERRISDLQIRVNMQAFKHEKMDGLPEKPSGRVRALISSKLDA